MSLFCNICIPYTSPSNYELYGMAVLKMHVQMKTLGSVVSPCCPVLCCVGSPTIKFRVKMISCKSTHVFAYSEKTLLKICRYHRIRNVQYKVYIPSPCLINSFGNEIGRETFGKFSRIFKRIMSLSVRHTPTFKPAVKHFRHTGQKTFASRRWNL